MILFGQLGKNLWATKAFFLVRFVASIVVSVVFLLVAAGIQGMFVSLLGESTFNYIVGGLLSLMLGVLLCNLLGRLLFMFVRGWHMAALAYAKKIQAKHLSALDAGMKVFSKHFTSFAVVYGAGVFLGKFAEEGADKLWKMLEEVPYLGSFGKIANNPIVKHIAKDLLDTGFDACIYYVVRYTKPGLDSDMEAIPKALRKYLYALPNVMGASLLSYALLYLLPMALRFLIIISIFLHSGIVSGILISVLLYPVFYVLRHVFFEPIETVILVSAYSKYCAEDTEAEAESSPYKGIVDAILDSIGFSDGESAEEAGEEVTPQPSKTREKVPKQRFAPPVPPPPTESPTVAEDDIIDVEPDQEEMHPQENILSESIAQLSQLLNSHAGDPSIIPVPSKSTVLSGSPDVIEDDEDFIDEPPEDTPSPPKSITEVLGGIDPRELSRGFEDTDNYDTLGGDDVDFN